MDTTSSSRINAAVISGSVAATIFTIALIVILVLFIKRSKRNKIGRHENNNRADEKNREVD